MNRVFLNFDSNLNIIWQEEKQATSESIDISRKEALEFLASKRERIMKFSREQAVKELLHRSKLINRIDIVSSVAENKILDID